MASTTTCFFIILVLLQAQLIFGQLYATEIGIAYIFNLFMICSVFPFSILTLGYVQLLNVVHKYYT